MPASPSSAVLPWRKTPNRVVTAAGVSFAYRSLGAARGVPLILLNHWGANLDNFDPRIVDGLAAQRPVIALNYRGVGGSGGRAPTTVAEMASDVLAVVRNLGLDRVDVLGFSLGGFVAQEVVRQAPQLVRRLILTGTGPAGGEGIDKVGKVSWPLILKAMMSFQDPKILLFFPPTPLGRQAGRAFIARLGERRNSRDTPIRSAAFRRQLKAIQAWGRQSPQDLAAVGQPTLVANGVSDVMVPSVNSKVLADRIPGAELVVYPNAGHGGIFQYHESFVAKACAFLDA